MSSLIDPSGVTVIAPDGVGSAHCEGIPLNSRITMEISPAGPDEEYGLYLRSNEKAEGGYRLNFSAVNNMVDLGNTCIKGVNGLNVPIKLDIVMKGDIIDVEINGKRTIVNRVYEQNGSFLWLYAKHGKVSFRSVKVCPLSE